MQYTYSLIIPHYNIPKLLRRLLRTVPRRDDLQVIVVDDCSTKDLEELETVKREFSWVEWYDTGTNGGGGKARNIGLDHAKGKYLIFADADDFFEPDLTSILDEYSYSDYDIAYFKGKSRELDADIQTTRANHLNKYIDDYVDGYDTEAFQLRFLFGEPWCKIIRRDIIEKYQIRFDEITIHNDTKFSYLVGYYCKNILVDERFFYCVTNRSKSVSKILNRDVIKTRINVFSKAEKFLTEHNVPNYSYEHYLQLVRLLAHGKIGDVRDGLNIIKGNGFSISHIYKNCFKILISILYMRFCKRKR